MFLNINVILSSVDAIPNFKGLGWDCSEGKIKKELKRGSEGGKELSNQRLHIVFTGKANIFCEECHYEY